jgi:hypothetical protein
LKLLASYELLLLASVAAAAASSRIQQLPPSLIFLSLAA